MSAIETTNFASLMSISMPAPSVIFAGAITVVLACFAYFFFAFSSHKAAEKSIAPVVAVEVEVSAAQVIEAPQEVVGDSVRCTEVADDVSKVVTSKTPTKGRATRDVAEVSSSPSTARKSERLRGKTPRRWD